MSIYYLTITSLQKLVTRLGNAIKILIKNAYRSNYLINTRVLKNNITDIFNNCIIAINTAVKYPSYLLNREAILDI